MNQALRLLPLGAGPEESGIEPPEQALNRNMRVGLITVGVFGILLVIIAAFANVRGAVIGSGNVSVESQVKRISHPTGGVIAEIFVRDGAHVKAGAPLMRLDAAVAGVSANVSQEGLLQMLAQRARLQAERDGLPSPAFPPQLTANGNPAAHAAIAEQIRLFRIRRQARQQLQAQLRERRHQMLDQIAGFQAQIGANERSVTLTKQELTGLRELWEKRLVTLNRLNQLERAAVEYQGSIASLQSNIAQARGRISEITEQSIQAEQEARSQAGGELAELMTRLNDQQIRNASSGDTLQRTLIASPSSGVVDKLAFTTIGGVVPPAQTIMEIVPDEDRLTVDAQVRTSDVDQLHQGQEAVLRFSAFSAQTTPELKGVVERISAEAATDEKTGYRFYRVRVAVSEGEMRRLGQRLVPGMPVEVHIQTNARSLLSYILKPLRDQLNRAFREG